MFPKHFYEKKIIITPLLSPPRPNELEPICNSYFNDFNYDGTNILDTNLNSQFSSDQKLEPYLKETDIISEKNSLLDYKQQQLNNDVNVMKNINYNSIQPAMKNTKKFNFKEYKNRNKVDYHNTQCLQSSINNTSNSNKYINEKTKQCNFNNTYNNVSTIGTNNYFNSTNSSSEKDIAETTINNTDTPNSEEWFTEIPDELEHILDHSNTVIDNNPINENILDSNTLSKINTLSDLCPNNTEEVNIVDNSNYNNETLNTPVIVRNTVPLPVIKLSDIDIFFNEINCIENLPNTDVKKVQNSEEIKTVAATDNDKTDLKYESTNLVCNDNENGQEKIFNDNITVENDLELCLDTNKSELEQNLNLKPSGISLLELDNEHENFTQIILNSNIILNKNIDNKINNEEHIQVNKEIDQNNETYNKDNIKENKELIKHEKSCSEENKDLKQQTVKPKNNKLSNVKVGLSKNKSKKKCKPDIIKQPKITTMLKAVKKSPTLDKPNTEKNIDALPEEISVEKRKITNHTPAINDDKISEEKKLKVDQNVNKEKKKISKRKSKFITPHMKSQETQENKYDICVLTEKSITSLQQHLNAVSVDEISFNIIFQENYCLLTQAFCGNNSHNPVGIMFHIFWNYDSIPADKIPEYYYIKLIGWTDISIPRTLIQTLFNNKYIKICFKAQSLIILLMQTFELHIKDIELNWIIHDPIIGCWLLDSDHPVSTFPQLLTQLKIKESYQTHENIMDNSCEMLIQLSAAMKKVQYFLQEKNLWHTFINMELKILTILSGMEFYGVLVDVEVLKRFGEILKIKLEKIEKKAYESIGKVFQLNSTVQLRNILYNELKLDVKNDVNIEQTATLKAKSTSETMLLQKSHPLPGLVLEFRHLSKVKSTYVDAMIQHINNGTIYSSWDQTSAATGRIACSNPNLQAIPKQPFSLTLFPENAEPNESNLYLRSAYISRSGYSLLAADFHHIELRVFAHLSQDKHIIKALNEPGDIFITLTKTWLGNTEEDISKDQREETKHLVYATMYGAGPNKIAGILKIPLHQATNVIKKFLDKFPSLKLFSKNTIELCQKQGYLRSISGRCRVFPNINNPIFKLKSQAERQAINFRIQGSAADICKAAMIATQEHLKPFDCKLLLQIHDELVWEVRDEHVPQVKDVVKKVMEAAGTLSVPLPVSVSLGKNWGIMQE